jgi:hypothetical protein
MATIDPGFSIDDQWAVTLTVSPDRVLQGSQAFLEVTLSPPRTVNIEGKSFTYTFTSTNRELQRYLVHSPRRT